MSNDLKITSAIFNEQISISTAEGNEGYSELRTNYGNDLFRYLYTLDSTQFEKIDTDQNDPGSLFLIKIPHLKKITNINTPTYIRFRVKTYGEKGIKQLAINKHLVSDVIKGTFVKTYLFDIRFNDYRLSEKKIMEKVLNHNTLVKTGANT